MQAFGLGHAEIARNTRHAEQLVNRGGMACRVLAHLQFAEREAERLDAPPQVQQPGCSDARTAVRLQAGRDQPQIREQLVRGGVATCAAGVCSAQSFADQAELAAVWLVAPLRHRLHAQLGSFSLDRFHQLWETACQAGRDAQVSSEGLDIFAIASEHRRACQTGRGAGDLGRDTGIAVTVATDPGAEPKAGSARAFRRHGVHGPMHERQHVVHRSRQHVQDALHFIQHARPFDACFGRLPHKRHTCAQCVEDAGPLERRGALVVELFDQPRRVLEVEQQRAASSLGRVRGEHGMDLETRQAFSELVRLHALGGQLRQRGGDGFVQR